MPSKEITPAQALGILAERIDKRKAVLSRLGNEMAYRVALAELDIVQGQILRAQEYFVSKHSETTVRSRK